MTTLRLEEPGRFKVFDEGPPSAGEGEAIVRVRRIGVCGTDFHAFRGKQPFFTYPRVLGHELGVEVVSAPPSSGLHPGDRCSVEPYLNCGTCVACRRGKPNCCTELRVLGVHVDGGMREELNVPAGKLHRSSKLGFEQLALVETLAIGCHAVARAAVQVGEPVLVVGAGPIGMSVIQFAAEAGGRVMVADVDEARLRFCVERLGVGCAIDARRADAAEKIRAAAGGDMPPAVFDATGNPASMASSFALPCHGGRLVFVGLFQGDLSFNDPAFHRRELTLLASRNALPGDFPRIIGLLEEGRIDTAPWITNRCALADAAASIPAWAQPGSGVVKAMVEIGG